MLISIIIVYVRIMFFWEDIMDTYTITWRGEVFGDLKITAETADEAKAKLASIPRSELVKHSSIWQHDKPVSVETVDTELGLFDKESWELVYE